MNLNSFVLAERLPKWPYEKRPAATLLGHTTFLSSQCLNTHLKDQLPEV